MKILALNLDRLGPSSGSRLGNLVRYFRASAADVLVLPEFKSSLFKTLVTKQLDEDGYRYYSTSEVSGPNQLGVAVFSCHKATPVPLSPPAIDKHRITALDMGGLVVAGVYFAQGNEKFTLFDFLLSEPQQFSGPTLIMGDFNTGLHFVDETGATLIAESRFKQLADCGWKDLWRVEHGERREYSWISNAGNGFRLDHAFARRIKRKVVDCYYDHGTRGTGGAVPKLSDHSAMIVELE
ncbi:MAG: hypothetical protein F4233_08135 [Rhodospirillaceae bacterium]|nr:hypothetical protein [Rhodospirillaceae bacterium]